MDRNEATTSLEREGQRMPEVLEVSQDARGAVEVTQLFRTSRIIKIAEASSPVSTSISSTSKLLEALQSTSANSYHTENPLIIDISSDSQEDVTQHANIVFHPFSSNIFGEISQKHLRLLNIIDDGSYGRVYRAVYGDKYCAVKHFVKSRSEKGFDAKLKDLQKELLILKKLSHPNIIKVHGFSSRHHLIIMELMECGNLEEAIHGKIIEYGEYDIIRWSFHCISALFYLHEQHIVHADLKPKNLLLSQNYEILKICDFGSAGKMHQQRQSTLGTVPYIAPEVLEATYSLRPSCDIFSFGMILFEMIAQEKPFAKMENANEILWRIAGGERPSTKILEKKASHHILDLLNKCWIHRAKHRVKTSDAYKAIKNHFLDNTESNTQIRLLQQPKSLSKSIVDNDNDLSAKKLAADL
ncbi:unnamed protein product [Dracunculus medinensis]|uniref:Mitogen-activated protein kinase kinase kinase n=1 Tax=Dracunculus medinensis TaxID=318479 RepID=A0A0N4UEM5_DRAME|nr:unnamed protein product [Dracunculus medinensis]